jgi:hypothetical protein
MNEDQARQVGLLLAMIRTAIGLTTLVAPSLARLWVGAPGATPGGRALSRSLAAREIVLGCGALFSGSNSVRLRTWLAAGALCDCVDSVGTASTPGLPRAPRVLVTLTSGAAAVAGGVAALSLPAQKSEPGALSAAADRRPSA